MKVSSKLGGVRFRTKVLYVPSSAEPDPQEHEFLRFVRPKKCIRKCENKEKLLPANSKFGYCSFKKGKFSRSWNASSVEDFLSCQEAIQELNQEVQDFLLTLPKDAENKKWSKEEGIVFSCKIAHIKLVYATIRVIRELFLSSIPVEVFVSKKNLTLCLKILTPLQNTICRVPRFGTLIEHPRSRFGWKVIAIMQSSFKNVLWLDTDCFPLVDPLELFQNENFKEKGAMFWPDLTGDQCDPHFVSVWPSASSEGALWNVFNLRFNSDNWKHVQEFESGQMVIDSELHLRALHLVYFLTENGIFQQFAYGDKEAFRWSWLAQDLDYYFSEYPAFLSYHNQFDQASKQCYRMHYLEGKPVFLHGKKNSRLVSKCGYEISLAKRLHVASIQRGINACSRGICYNQTSFLCKEKSFSYMENTVPVSNEVQVVEDSWEEKYSQWI